ncbi:MAG: quinol dehydrogenase ferredoxin subunit NapH [Alphaproteobacteria bacterium]|nr:quinol dehydrogenase ferredoxin subunit NapH [Alphaproteobacteria bacterium]
MKSTIPGRKAMQRHGWWLANRFLVLRRLAQLGFLALFLAGPLFGVWIVKGTLASSKTPLPFAKPFDALPLSDPLIVLQALAARHIPETEALIGALIVLVAYLILGGRTYCSWVCPINPIADLAAYLRRRLNLGKGLVLRQVTRMWMLALIIVVSALTGTIAWEIINPITALWRGIVFGLGFSFTLVVAIFLFDLLVANQGWCGHICPVGAFYGLLGRVTLLRVSVPGRARCDDCLECFAVCPEMHVIAPALRGEKLGNGPIITSPDCTVCGRCIDVCSERCFVLTHRFNQATDPPVHDPVAMQDGRA